MTRTLQEVFDILEKSTAVHLAACLRQLKEQNDKLRENLECLRSNIGAASLARNPKGIEVRYKAEKALATTGMGVPFEEGGE